MSAKITQITQHPKYGHILQWRRQRVFDLGRHEFMGAPGLSWITNYWIKKIERGKYWQLYSSQKTSLKRKEYCGIFKHEQLRDFFDEVRLLLNQDYWLRIGLGRKAEVIYFMVLIII